MHTQTIPYSDPLQQSQPMPLPLLPDAHTYSYPKGAGRAPKVRHYPLDAILTRAWTTDAHFTAYSVETYPYRLSRDAVRLEGGVCMVLYVSDVDCALSHAAGGGHGELPAPDEWWLQELVKIEALQREFPGAFIYRTRGGYRIVYWLPEPRILRSHDDARVWSDDYLSWVAALSMRFNIHADPGCKDWQRLYRVPHATRACGGRPEARESLGHPYQIGVWTCEPTTQERELAKTLDKRKRSTTRPRLEDADLGVHVGAGILFYAFTARGWIDKEIEPGKWSARCPWDHLHTKGKDFDTSTVLYAPGAGDALGWLHCSHAHCQTLDIRDVLAVFSQAELDQARQVAGLPRFSEKSERWPSRITVEVA
jgi:hypothetical protein